MTDWIEWNGGECPVPEDTLVRVRFRSGNEDDCPADILWWGRTSGNLGHDIIAYRIIKDEDNG